jgi:hypothetical protein
MAFHDLAQSAAARFAIPGAGPVSRKNQAAKAVIEMAIKPALMREACMMLDL